MVTGAPAKSVDCIESPQRLPESASGELRLIARPWRRVGVSATLNTVALAHEVHLELTSGHSAGQRISLDVPHGQVMERSVVHGPGIQETAKRQGCNGPTAFCGWRSALTLLEQPVSLTATIPER
jgi:hypothetical protein